MPDDAQSKIAHLVDLLLEELERRLKNTTPLAFDQAPPRKGLLTLAEAADYLCMTHGALYAATSRRQIPFVKFGRRLRFRKEDLDAFIEANLVKPEPPISPDGRRGRRAW